LLDWTTNAFLYYVDGHLYETQTGWGSSTTNAYPFPFNQPFFFIMNLAIGGQYLGYPAPSQINAGTPFPAEMQVDYLRIYNQTKPLLLTIIPTNSGALLTWPSNIIMSRRKPINPPAAGLGQTGLTSRRQRTPCKSSLAPPPPSLTNQPRTGNKRRKRLEKCPETTCHSFENKHTKSCYLWGRSSVGRASRSQ
jgi:hypothetical protein